MDGDVVMVSPGTYVENILIETAITVQGSDPLSPAMIDGSSPDPSSPNAWNESCVVIKTSRGNLTHLCHASRRKGNGWQGNNGHYRW